MAFKHIVIRYIKPVVSIRCGQSLVFCINIKAFEFSTLNITIPHDQLKGQLNHLNKQNFFYKNWKKQYNCLYWAIRILNLWRTTLILKENTVNVTGKILSKCWTLNGQYISTLRKIGFQQTAGILNGNNCSPLLADLFFVLA